MLDKETQKSYSSLENALRLLQMFSMDDPELSVTEIAERMEVGISTAHRLLNSLVSEGFVTKDPQSNLYCLGASILALGQIVISTNQFPAEVISILENLVEKTGESAHICILKGTDIIYLHKVECDHPVRLLSHLGKRNPAYCTSSGQAILAYHPDKYLEELYSKGLKAYTTQTITSISQLKQLMKKIRMQGYAFSQEELHYGVASLGAPIWNRQGEVIASVNIAGPIQRINLSALEKLSKHVIQASKQMTNYL